MTRATTSFKSVWCLGHNSSSQQLPVASDVIYLFSCVPVVSCFTIIQIEYCLPAFLAYVAGESYTERGSDFPLWENPLSLLLLCE